VGTKNVRVRDAAREPDFLLETVEKQAIGPEGLVAQGLDCDELVELPVVRLVHGSQAALAENRLDLVAGGEEGADLRFVA
jgi:hypothetical protein